jgi:hypothetical protein
MATQLRPWSQRAAVQSERKSLLDSLVDNPLAPRETPSLLDLIADGPIVSVEVRIESRTATVVVPETETIRMVEFQLLDWTLVLIPCPACQCYPCKPGHVNGHTEMWLPVAGDVVRVRI